MSRDHDRRAYAPGPTSATGPFALGLMHGATGGWTVPMAALAVTAVGQLLVGLVLSGNRGAGATPAAKRASGT